MEDVFYRRMVEEAAQSVVDSGGQLDLVDYTQAAAAGFNLSAFQQDVEREADDRTKNAK